MALLYDVDDMNSIVSCFPYQSHSFNMRPCDKAAVVSDTFHRYCGPSLVKAVRADVHQIPKSEAAPIR